MRMIVVAAALSLAAPITLAQQAPDALRGQRIYEVHCLTCHYERLHERPRSRSRVHSLAELRTEVALRARLTGQSFTLQDLDDIAEYLNQTHYRFER